MIAFVRGLLLSGMSLLGLAFAGCGGGAVTPPPPPMQKFPFQAAHTQQWVTQFGTGTVFRPDPNTLGLAGDTLTGVATDPQGNIGISASTLGNFSGYSGPVGVSKDVIAKLDASGKVLWIRQFGTSNGDYLQSISSDTSGDFYVGGLTLGAFQGYSNPSQSIQAVVAKFDDSGNLVWVKQFQVLTATTAIVSIAADDSGHVIVGGYTNLNGDVSTQEIFVASLDASNGQQQWLKQFGPSIDIWSVAVDSNGGVFASGDSTGTFPYTGGGSDEPFILKLNGSDGSKVWVQQLQTQFASEAASIFSLAVMPRGNVIAGGAVSSAHFLVLGQGTDPSDSGLLAELDASTGNVIWLKQFSSGDGDEVHSVAVDSQGNVLACGMTNGLLAPGFVQPENDVSLMKFNASGENLWAQQIGLGFIEVLQGQPSSPQVAVDPSGNIFLGNVTQGAFPGASNPNNAVEMFVAKFGP